jgi:hypothetical protein
MAAELGLVYTSRQTATILTAITAIQVVAAAAKPLVLIRGWMTESASATAAQAGIHLVRKSAAGTAGAAVTPVKHNLSAAAASHTAGHQYSAEGTVTDTLDEEGFNVVNGWLYLPTPDEQVVVPGAGILGAQFAAAPATQTWRYGLTVVEIG